MKLITRQFPLFTLLLATLLVSNGCGVYSPYGAQTSGAKSFSVEYFKPQTPLASAQMALNFTEALKDLIQRQSTLDLLTENGELQFSGLITNYDVRPVSVQSDETASLSRLSVTVKLKYVNTLNSELDFERNFAKFADFDSNSDLFTVEEGLLSEINEQLTREIFNATLGNW
jgi:hypothetical protein